MNDQRAARVQPSSRIPRRGRPVGATKTRQQEIRDRVRTVATLNHLFNKVCCANNLAQFSRWFDETMHARYPGRTWDTNVSNKWRKNFYGTVAMTDEWVQYLNVLFPDGRYYSAQEATGDPLACVPTQPLAGMSNGSIGALTWFRDGPGQLWHAIWEDAAIGVWDADSYEAALDDLEMKLYSNFDCDELITYQDLAQAVRLYRVQLPVDDQARLEYPLEWGIRSYLCLKLAIAANQPDVLGVMSDIADYFADMELARLKADRDYAFAIRKEWMRRGVSCTPSVGEYAMNPFLSLWDQCSNEHFCRRYARLASLTDRSMRPAK